MRKLALAAAMLLAGGASASAAQLTVTSPDIKPGARIADEQVANGFGCSGGNCSPALVWSGAPQGDQELRAERLRSRCADRQRLLALGDVRHSRRRDVAAQERRRSARRPSRPPARSRATTTPARRAISAPARPRATSRTTITSRSLRVDVDKLDADATASPARGRLQPALPHARESDAYRDLGSLAAGGASAARDATGLGGQASSNRAGPPSAASGLSATGAG